MIQPAEEAQPVVTTGINRNNIFQNVIMPCVGGMTVAAGSIGLIFAGINPSIFTHPPLQHVMEALPVINLLSVIGSSVATAINVRNGEDRMLNTMLVVLNSDLLIGGGLFNIFH